MTKRLQQQCELIDVRRRLADAWNAVGWLGRRRRRRGARVGRRRRCSRRRLTGRRRGRSRIDAGRFTRNRRRGDRRWLTGRWSADAERSGELLRRLDRLRAGLGKVPRLLRVRADPAECRRDGAKVDA
jgi:hypothetical protein